MGSPVYLNDYYLTRFNVEFRDPEGDAHQQNDLTLKLEFDYDLFSRADSPLSRKLALRVELLELADDGSVAGYRIQCEIVGVFTIAPDVPKDQAGAVAILSGIGLLYGTLRGIVGNVTGNFLGGRVALPAVNPQDIAELVEKRNAAERQKPKKRKPRKKA